VSIDAALLALLVCPDPTHRAPLIYDAAAETLTCTECSLIFDVVDGIPDLLLDDARPASTPTGEG
jgi:uncharacterized protein